MSSGARVLAKAAFFVLIATLPSALLIWVMFGQPTPATSGSTAEPTSPAPPLATAPKPSQGPALPPGHPAIGASAVPRGAQQSVGSVSLEVAYAGDASLLPPSAMVFVFLREAGQRMPLTVERFPAGDLPRSVSLNVPEDHAQALEAVARLSRDGDVRLDPQDRESVRDLALRSGAGAGASLALEIPAVP